MADCLKIVDTANKNRLSQDQLDEILTELNAEKKARQAEGALENIESSIFNRGLVMAKEAELAKKIEKRNRYMNILKEQKLMALVQRADEMTGNPSLGLEAALVGVNAPFEGAARSVDSITGALVNSYAGGMIADLKKIGLLVKFNNMKGDFERQVANVLGDLNMKTPVGVAEASADAVALGKILFKYQRAAIQRENQAGSYIRLKEGRVVRASHDQRRMVKAGQDEWKGYIRDKLDYEKMGIAPERIDGFAKRVSAQRLVKHLQVQVILPKRKAPLGCLPLKNQTIGMTTIRSLAKHLCERLLCKTYSLHLGPLRLWRFWEPTRRQWLIVLLSAWKKHIVAMKRN